MNRHFILFKTALVGTALLNVPFILTLQQAMQYPARTLRAQFPCLIFFGQGKTQHSHMQHNTIDSLVTMRRHSLPRNCRFETKQGTCSISLRDPRKMPTCHEKYNVTISSQITINPLIKISTIYYLTRKFQFF